MMTQLFHYGKSLFQDHVVIDCAFFWGKQIICILDCLLFCFAFSSVAPNYYNMSVS